MVSAFKAVYRIGGPSGYFRGMRARVLYQMPSTAICWSTYEFFKFILLKSKSDKAERDLAVTLPSMLLPAVNLEAEQPRRTDKIDWAVCSQGAAKLSSVSFTQAYTDPERGHS